jgi:hypothetical protein
MTYLEPVRRVLENLWDYWPLTLRQVYYQLVAALVVENKEVEYKKLSRMLVKARLDGLIPWEALEDRARATLHSGGFWDKSHFIAKELNGFLAGYRRDLLQSQDVALEVWVEKDALSHVCHRAAFPYCVPVVVARGFSSVSYLNECRRRVKGNTAAGKRTVILYFGDLDPSGWEMLPAMLTTLQGEMGLGEQVEGKRYALVPKQVGDYSLPQSIDAMKDTDTRTPKFKAMLRKAGYPDTLAGELDALPPATLEGLVEGAIRENLDLSRFETERQRQETECQALDELQGQVHRLVRGIVE